MVYQEVVNVSMFSLQLLYQAIVNVSTDLYITGQILQYT